MKKFRFKKIETKDAERLFLIFNDDFFFINKENKKSRKAVESVGAEFSHTYEEVEDVYRKKLSDSNNVDLSL